MEPGLARILGDALFRNPGISICLRAALLAWTTGATTMAGDAPIIIAHRGASGYLPEHTLEAKALAYGMGADYIEQDVVLTRDGVPIVLHDIHLDTVSDVAEKFADRKRDDGRFYAIDLTLEEIRSLRVTERFDRRTGDAIYPARFPPNRSRFEIPTLAEEIELVQGLNQSTGRSVGIYPEIKAPAWHRREGQDISRIVLEVLAEYGFTTRKDRIYVQCFDAAETRRLREELGCDLKLIQLIGENNWGEGETDHEFLRTPPGLDAVAEYADGIGPRLSHVCGEFNTDAGPTVTPLVDLAHERSLEVHPFTVRNDDLPDGVDGIDELLRAFFEDAAVDGLFTDHPDRLVEFLKRHSDR